MIFNYFIPSYFLRWTFYNLCEVTELLSKLNIRNVYLIRRQNHLCLKEGFPDNVGSTLKKDRSTLVKVRTSSLPLENLRIVVEDVVTPRKMLM